jgi:hypothetical protein
MITTFKNNEACLLDELTRLLTNAGYSTVWSVKNGEVWLYNSVYLGKVEEVLQMTPEKIIEIDEAYLHHRFEGEIE